MGETSRAHFRTRATASNAAATCAHSRGSRGALRNLPTSGCRSCAVVGESCNFEWPLRSHRSRATTSPRRCVGRLALECIPRGSARVARTDTVRRRRTAHLRRLSQASRVRGRTMWLALSRSLSRRTPALVPHGRLRQSRQSSALPQPTPAFAHQVIQVRLTARRSATLTPKITTHSAADVTHQMQIAWMTKSSR